ncbi:MAG: GTP-binding protein TypA [Deltaproteobacteria bacterium RIFCSPHIGHO2_02_FULL_40_11]|nr:MAG: GTP-binding protein TypA [Deltaproteobacteria bacterium RIFCSPHIGHO2_02_FULL_40_11]
MNIRNVAIIAHVDHGKTTLVDALLRQSKTKLDKDLQDVSCIMDSNELERERGITIFSKNAAVEWNGTKINIIDTPGHADFGGEVERVLSMADGCLLLVDAKEGPMPQTRFVLKQALSSKLKVIVVINKIDKADARPSIVLDKIFDLFIELGADDQALDFPVVYASSKLGKAGLTPELDQMKDISSIFDTIFQHVAAPTGDITKPLQMRVAMISANNFKGRIAMGRIYQGTLKTGQNVMHISRSGAQKPYRLTSIMAYQGLESVEVQEALAGDIVAISGIPDITIGETVSDVNYPVALPVLGIEQPTLRMTFRVNSSPFAGKEGEFKTSRQIRDRLYKELEKDVALRVEDAPDGSWIVSGRGELHLAIFIERMRREGYEFEVSQPEVITKNVEGVRYAPFEKVFIEVPEDYTGTIMQKMGMRHAEMMNMQSENGIYTFEFIVSTRELFGFRGEFLTDTKGLGLINTLFHDYQPDSAFIRERDRGSLVAHEDGVTNLYGLLNAQERGKLFIGPGIPVYKGQIVGQNSRGSDMRVNVCKEKHLSNMRSKGDGVSEHFEPPKQMDLEDCLEYIDGTELVEVTPKTVRMRKKSFI